MRFWTRLALIAWLLTGLVTAPAMAFGMTCHGGMDRMAMASDMPAGMHMDHKSMPERDNGTHQKAFACAVHCLSAGTGFILPPSTEARRADVSITPTFSLAASLRGQIPGPQLEPPISSFV